jgi:hypothetical protein
LLASIDATQIAEAFVNDFHEGTTVDKAFVKAWAKSHIKPDNTQLSKALDQVWGDGYHLGRVAGLAAIGFVRVRKDAATDKQINDALNVDWSTWIPGNAGAAYIAHPKGSLGRLLNKKASTLKNLDDTSVERIGTLLSDALLEGLAPADLARRIIDDVGNSVSSASRALTIATTEMNGAMSIASMDAYEENGIELVEWVGLDACDICEPNIEASPIPRGQEFPSGDTEPEAHPNCRCSIAPFIDWGDGGSPFGAGVYDDIQQGIYEDIMGDGIDLAVKPNLVKYSEDQPRESNGRFGSGGSSNLRNVSMPKPSFPEDPKHIYRGMLLTTGDKGQGDKTIDELMSRMRYNEDKGYGTWWSSDPDVAEQNSTGDQGLNATWVFGRTNEEAAYGVMLEARLNNDYKPVSAENAPFALPGESVVSGPTGGYYSRDVQTLTAHFFRRDPDGTRTYVGAREIDVSNKSSEAGAAFAQNVKAIRPNLSVEPMLGVPGPLEAERALSRLAILPNPADAGLEEPEKYVESPWEVVEPPTVDPNIWDKAVKTLVNLDELFGTDPYLKRKRVRKHIEAMGQALTEFRSYPLVVVYKGNTIILDGHHRLMSIWLLGQETAAVWKVKI